MGSTCGSAPIAPSDETLLPGIGADRVTPIHGMGFWLIRYAVPVTEVPDTVAVKEPIRAWLGQLAGENVDVGEGIELAGHMSVDGLPNDAKFGERPGSSRIFTDLIESLPEGVENAQLKSVGWPKPLGWPAAGFVND